MAETVDKIIGISSSVSAVLAFIFYRYYKGRGEFAKEVKKVPILQPDSSLLDTLHNEDGNGFEFAAVEGLVRDLGRTLSSRHMPVEGVVMKTQLMEHKSKRVNGFWSDVNKELRHNVQSVPFALIDSENGNPLYKVEIVDATSASHLQEEMDITYDQFEPHKSSLVQVGLDRIFGEVTRGIQETESMLVNGTSVLALGRVFLERGKAKLGPPTDDKYPFIITKMSLRELVKSYESQSRTLKILCIISVLVSSGLLCWLVFRNLKKWLRRREEQIQFERIRRALRMQGSGTPSADESGDNEVPEENSCVICLSNARQVIALPCGHISSCLQCAEALPNPKKCPICRADVERFMQAFYS